MADNQMQENTTLINVGTQAGSQKAGEFFVDKALNALIDGIKKVYGGSQVLLGTAFSRYLTNATERYNQVRTIATGNITRSIIGQDNLYVSIGVQHEKEQISTDTVDPLLRVSKNILVQGTGGTGKSMMMRYLFLNTANRGEYVPVLLELRKIRKQDQGQISIMDLIYTCLKDFDVALPNEQFEFSLRLGKYLFLMDGFDEVKESIATETAEAIQSFCAKYPKNPCIITSRPRRETSPLETFTTVLSCPLSKDQAIALAQKIWKEDEKTRAFCEKLRDEYYTQYRDFAENPLLLSLMFLTFMRNNSVPNHLAEFYRQAFDALYSTHDSKNKGFYRRELRCKNLDEPDFRKILSHFCFHSYRKQDYEFTEEKIKFYLQKSLSKIGHSDIQAIDYLEDLKNSVCLIVQDGLVFRFAHRSFQTYFAACYTNDLMDEEQKRVFKNELSVSSGRGLSSKDDYCNLLLQICPRKFLINATEDHLRIIKNQVDNAPLPDIHFLKLEYSEIWATGFLDCTFPDIECSDFNFPYDPVLKNSIHFFRKYVSQDKDDGPYELISKIHSTASSVKINKSSDLSDIFNGFDLTFAEVDSCDKISNEERIKFYLAVAQFAKVKETRIAIDEWLQGIDEERNRLQDDSYIDEL